MNMNADTLTELLTGCEDTDRRIRAAFDLGCRQGKDLDRHSLKLNTRIQTTRMDLISLMTTQGMDLQTAMLALRIPRSERKTYIKILDVQKKNKRT